MKTKIFILIGCLIVNLTVAQSYKTEIIVAQDGSGDFTSIQQAINSAKAFPDVPVIIRIRKGTYHEKVKVHSWNTKLSLIGEDRSMTIITFDDYFDKIDLGRNSTFYTYTLMVDANDFHAENLTVINSAGPVGQAVALHVEGDRCSFVNCSFLGNQDTMYNAGEGARQFFDKCYIEGTTDFIFGEATAVFRDCEIRSKADSYITAASTTAHQRYGFVFLHCTLTADDNVHQVYLGRPWREFARTVFIHCYYSDHIRQEGWDHWNDDHKMTNVFYGEYECVGPGAIETKRAPWTHQLSKKEVKEYSLEKIFGEWNPGLPAKH